MRNEEEKIKIESKERLYQIFRSLWGKITQHPKVFIVLALFIVVLAVLSVLLGNVGAALPWLFAIILFCWFIGDSYISAWHNIAGCLAFLVITSLLVATVAGAVFLPAAQEISRWAEGSYGFSPFVLENGITYLTILAVQSFLYGLIGYFAERKVAVVSIAIVAGGMGMLAAGIGAFMQFVPMSVLTSYVSSFFDYPAFAQEFDIRGMLTVFFQALLFPYWFSSIVGAVMVEFRKGSTP